MPCLIETFTVRRDGGIMYNWADDTINSIPDYKLALARHPQIGLRKSWRVGASRVVALTQQSGTAEIRIVYLNILCGG